MAQKQTVNGGTFTNYHDDTPEALKNERRAMLAMMAEHGTAGQAEYMKAQNAAKAARAASIEMAAARGAQIHAPGTLQAALTQETDRVMGGLNDARTAALMGHGREMDRIASANAAYLDQAAAGSQLNRDMLNAQMLASSRRGGGGGGGGGRGGGGGGGGGGPASADPKSGLDYLEFDAFRRDNQLTDTETFQALDKLRNEEVIDGTEWDAWGRASMQGMQIPGLNAPMSAKAQAKADALARAVELTKQKNRTNKRATEDDNIRKNKRANE